MPIDRKSLVTRHDVYIRALDEYSPLSVGNGELAFTVDPTGFQTFGEYYETGIPLCTQSQWGWHTYPFDESSGDPREKIEMTLFDSAGRKIGYPVRREGQEKEYDWLRQNPHRLNLGRIGLSITKDDGREAGMFDIGDIDQRLCLYEGTIYSSFTAFGERVRVTTCCHPYSDTLAFFVYSPLLAKGRIRFSIGFPYGSHSRNASDWEHRELHSTLLESSAGTSVFTRTLDNDAYYVCVSHVPGTEIRSTSANAFLMIPGCGLPSFDFSVFFSPDLRAPDFPSFQDTLFECRKYWEGFWNEGGAVELSMSGDERALEIERRTVLSQYLTAIQCSGSLPPQETGLTCNSWYGKFHLEMHWWHSVHFAYWKRSRLFERSMRWYAAILDKARETARRQGYRGARWPKMTSASGEESPSPIGPFIVWQQPHPIYYAELFYKTDPSRATLELYGKIVFETAEFMVSFLSYDASRDRYSLVPPVIPAQENHDPTGVLNPTFEVEYWRFALSIACVWRKRLGLEPDYAWKLAIDKLAGLPVSGGCYIAHELCPDTFERFNYDHPSMLAAYGMIRGSRIDAQIMKNTLRRVMDSWDMERTWGWDFPLIAMCAARLGEPELAVEALLHGSPNNLYLANGHNRQGGNDALPVYLPGNGALLCAIAMMAAGWDESGDAEAPGFPANGKWKVATEGIIRFM